MVSPDYLSFSYRIRAARAIFPMTCHRCCYRGSCTKSFTLSEKASCWHHHWGVCIAFEDRLTSLPFRSACFHSLLSEWCSVCACGQVTSHEWGRAKETGKSTHVFLTHCLKVTTVHVWSIHGCNILRVRERERDSPWSFHHPFPITPSTKKTCSGRVFNRGLRWGIWWHLFISKWKNVPIWNNNDTHLSSVRNLLL